MDTRQLEYFAAVADELHFGQAAARMHVSQPALSQQVRALERRLGAQLLERTTRSVRLTPLGRAVHEHVRELLEQREQALDHIDRLVSGRAGRLRIGFVPSAAFDLLPQIIAPFGRSHPHVELHLREMPTMDQLRKLAADELDIGLVRDIQEAPAVRLIPLVTEPLLLACPKDHPAAAHRRVRLSTLSGDRFVVLPTGVAPAMYAVVEKLTRAADVNLESALVALAFPTTLGLVASGLGVAIVPAAVRTNHPPGLAYRPIADPGAVSHLAAAVPDRHHDPLVEQLLHTAQAVTKWTPGTPTR